MRSKTHDVGGRATQSPAGRQQLKFFSDDGTPARYQVQRLSWTARAVEHRLISWAYPAHHGWAIGRCQCLVRGNPYAPMCCRTPERAGGCKAEVPGLPSHCPSRRGGVRLWAEIPLTFKIPPTMKRITMRLCEDPSGGLYLQSGTTGVALCSLQGVLDLGWSIVTVSPAERDLLAAHGFKVSP